jgi:hypothetical protein
LWELFAVFHSIRLATLFPSATLFQTKWIFTLSSKLNLHALHQLSIHIYDSNVGAENHNCGVTKQGLPVVHVAIFSHVLLKILQTAEMTTTIRLLPYPSLKTGITSTGWKTRVIFRSWTWIILFVTMPRPLEESQLTSYPVSTGLNHRGFRLKSRFHLVSR